MTPTTEAGRALHSMTTSDLLRDLIPIIEQEAAAAERARIVAAVEGLRSAMQSEPRERVVNRAAVLAAIRGKP